VKRWRTYDRGKGCDRVKEGADRWGLSMVWEEGGHGAAHTRGGGGVAVSLGEGGRKGKGAWPGGPAWPARLVRGQMANGPEKNK
jgi:hypothetical protein